VANSQHALAQQLAADLATGQNRMRAAAASWPTGQAGRNRIERKSSALAGIVGKSL